MYPPALGPTQGRPLHESRNGVETIGPTRGRPLHGIGGDMPDVIDAAKLKGWLQRGAFDDLFDELLWDNPDGLRPTPVSLKHRGDEAAGRSWTLLPVRQKRGVAVFSCDLGETVLDRETRRRIGREMQKTAHEHLIVFHTSNYLEQVWLWPYREPGKPARPREIPFRTDQNAAQILGLLRNIQFDFANEGTLT